MPCKNECAIIDTIYTRSVPTKLGHNCLTEYPVGLELCRTTLGCPTIIFGKVGQSFCFVKFDTTMPYMVKIAQLMIPQPPLGSKISLFLPIRAAVSEIQLFLTLNGKLALIGY